MSILIKGMEMPNKKNGAVIIIYPDGKVSYENGEQYTAVPIPPHGRTIDADAFIRNIAKLERVDPITAAGVIAFVNAAPTIIEAEGE